MTFHDTLEAQLVDAAARRYRRRRLRIGFEPLAVGGVLAAGVALIIALSGGGDRSTTHSAHSPATAQAPALLAEEAKGPTISILNASGRPNAATPLARRMFDQGAKILTTADIEPVPFTRVLYRPGHAAAALAVSRFVGGIDVRDVGLRVEPLSDLALWSRAGRETDVLVLLGEANHMGEAQLRADASTIAYQDDPPTRADRLPASDVFDAAYAVLHHRPIADGAVLGGPVQSFGNHVVVPVELTATGERALVSVSRVDGCWIVWDGLEP